MLMRHCDKSGPKIFFRAETNFIFGIETYLFIKYYSQRSSATEPGDLDTFSGKDKDLVFVTTVRPALRLIRPHV